MTYVVSFVHERANGEHVCFGAYDMHAVPRVGEKIMPFSAENNWRVMFGCSSELDLSIWRVTDVVHAVEAQEVEVQITPIATVT